MSKCNVRARVRVELEIDSQGSWESGCPLDQVRKQAIQEVEQVLRRGVVINGLIHHDTGRNPDDKHDVQRTLISATPLDWKVTAILVEDSR